MISMIKYQQQYQAAAKLINIIDGIYDTTINRLGV
jgi:flagellar hook-associated protein FlgK